MGVSRKIILLQIFLWASFICIIMIMGQQVWGKNYLQLEQDDVIDNATRTYLAWDTELNYLGSQVGDWSPWDDLYAFAKTKGKTNFAQENLNDAEMANLKINLAVVTSPDGDVCYAKAIDLASKTQITVSDETVQRISRIIKDHVMEPQEGHYIKGFIVVDGRPLLLAMQRILTSYNTGPSTGIIIFGKYADAAFMDDISRKTQVKVTFEAKRPLAEHFANGSFSQQIVSDQEILNYFPVLDAYGNIRYLVSTTPRTIYHQGRVQMKSFLIFAVVFGAVFSGITLLLLNKVILAKVRKMDSFMNSIVAGNDYSIRINLPGNDELSKAAATMNNMLQQIQSSHQKIGDLYAKVSQELEERLKAEDTLRYLSMHDQLTSLYNRTFFEQEVCNISQMTVGGLGVVCCDLDGLKLANDTMGHHVGDKILVETADMLRRTFGEKAIIARTGGDEFSILLLNIAEEEIHQMCDAVSDVEIKDPEGRGIKLHLSLGWVYYDGATVTKELIDRLRQQADDLMYRHKLSSSHSNRSALVQGMLELLKVRDFITEGHSQRLEEYVESLGKAVNLKDGQIADLRLLAKYHDIGKVGIADTILFKPGKLTPEERRDMERHSEIGHRIAMAVPELTPIKDIILKHHEWWNGKGYPLGTQGEAIPVEARILAIADAYDAMTSNRPYRAAMSRDDAIEELRRFAGVQFDPELVEKFIALILQGR